MHSLSPCLFLSLNIHHSQQGQINLIKITLFHWTKTEKKQNKWNSLCNYQNHLNVPSLNIPCSNIFAINPWLWWRMMSRLSNIKYNISSSNIRIYLYIYLSIVNNLIKCQSVSAQQSSPALIHFQNTKIQSNSIRRMRRRFKVRIFFYFIKRFKWKIPH